MTLRLITAPTIEPATVAEVKLDAKIDGIELDAPIAIYIAGARKNAESITGRALLTQTWELVLDEFPEGSISIGMLPIRSITSVKYYDSSGVLQTLAANQYALDADTLPGWVRPAYGVTWPSTYSIENAVIVRFVAGYGDAATDVPAEIRMWIRAIAAAEADKQGCEVSEFVNGLLDGYKLYWI